MPTKFYAYLAAYNQANSALQGGNQDKNISTQDNWNKFLTTARQKYPLSFQERGALAHLSPNLVSDVELDLPKSVKIQAEQIVATLFRLRGTAKYQALVGPLDFAPGNFSALMSYDFHYADNRLRLIEINTNASSGLIGELIYLSRGLAMPFVGDFSKEIISTFRNEFSLGSGLPDPHKAWILDERPHGQRLYCEFLFFQELFQQTGWACDIVDSQALPDTIDCDLIYNRHTDFYLSSPELAPILKAYKSKRVVLSPNPVEYHLLANKKRLIDIYLHLDKLDLSQNEQDLLRQCLLECRQISSLDQADELWSQRRNLFFKPLTSFGGKAAYRGESVSKKVFNELFSEKSLGNYMAQEYLPAPEKLFQTSHGEMNLKYDLRFYVYQDNIQMGLARLYQGQTTNLQTLGAGLTPITWS